MYPHLIWFEILASCSGVESSSEIGPGAGTRSGMAWPLDGSAARRAKNSAILFMPGSCDKPILDPIRFAPVLSRNVLHARDLAVSIGSGANVSLSLPLYALSCLLLHSLIRYAHDCISISWTGIASGRHGQGA